MDFREKKRNRTASNIPPLRTSDAPQEDQVSSLLGSGKKKVCLSSIKVPGNRALLEVLKICSPIDVLESLSFVNRQWAETSSSNDLSKELWGAFQEDLYIPDDRPTHPKLTCAAYIRQQKTVVDLHRDHMQVLNQSTGEWNRTPLSEPIQIDHWAYTLLLDGSLLVCGGMHRIGLVQQYEKRTFRISLDGVVTELAPMVTGRVFHGIAAYGRKIFVFGGFAIGMDLLTNEVYADLSWAELPAKLNFQHQNFVPCVYQGLIYICDSFSNAIEVFHPEFLTIEVLARPMIPLQTCNAVTVYEGSLVLIGETHVWKWHCGRKRVAVSIKPKYSFRVSKMRTVLHGDILYLITTANRLMINMKTFARKHFKHVPQVDG